MTCVGRARWRRPVAWLRATGLGLLVFALSSMGWRAYRAQAGEPSARLDDDWHRGHQLQDRHGAVLRELPTTLGQRGQPLALADIGDRLVIATIVAEDHRFYEHSGFDARATLRAMAQNARHLRVVSGASTISQQLVKLLDNGGKQPKRRTVAMKLSETARAQNLEADMSKQAILEAYLNRLPYGRGFAGPQAASSGMFGVAPSQLSWAQATLLAVLPRAPSYLDPYRHLDRAVVRQRELLRALHEAHWLSREDHQRALDEPIALRPITRAFEAPHLVEGLRLGKLARYGSLGEEETRTTLDLPLQRAVEGAARTHVARTADKGAHNAAVVVVDNASGEVLAYVGSVDWADPDISGQVDMARARRQPGSTLKPFVYAMAFEEGTSPAHALADIPTQFGEAAGEYLPQNFNRSFAGPISAREALAGSLNVPAVRLGATLPPGALQTRLQQLGLHSLDQPAEHYGLSLVLGSGEVTLLELAEAYVALARGGERLPLRVTTGQPSRPERVMVADAVAAISDSLSDPLARVRGLGSRGPFNLGFPVAVKTGTSSGYRDSWTVGYTQQRTVAVWMGNADGRPSQELTGGAGAGHLFVEVMRRAMRGLPTLPLVDRSQLREVEVCPLSGRPMADSCPEAVRRLVPKGQHATEDGVCAMHRHVKLNGSGGAKNVKFTRVRGGRCVATGGKPAVVLPSVYADWLNAQPYGAPGRDSHGLLWLSADTLEGCSDSPRRARLVVDDPHNGTVVVKVAGVSGQQQQVRLAAHFEGPPRQAPRQLQFLIDGEVVASSRPPYRAMVTLARGDHYMMVRPAAAGRALAPARVVFSVR